MVIRTSTVAIFCFLLICQSIVECHSQRHFAKWNQFYTDNENEPALREPACSEEHTKNWFIYCQGTILEAVNAQRLFNDSKDFVDSPLRSSPEDVQAAFTAHFGNNSNNVWAIDRNLLKNFVDQHFDKPGSELVSCEPADWKAEPTRLIAIQDPELRQWALQLNGIWKKLCKKIRPEIADQPDRVSLIYVPNEFIAPGGRFREFYYWDAYWIVRGLMASEMYGSAKKMIQNLAHMVNSYGFVPNGGRVYYLRRSQPPLLAPMLFEYYEHTGDREFLRQMLPVLETEVQFWDLRRRVDVPVENDTSKAYVFRADSSGPRPESFKEDMAQAQGLPDEQKAFFFKSVASAAESGWDFSSRWLRDSQHLASIETLNIVPVDLNAFMCWNFNILEDLYFEIRNYGKARHYRGRKFEMQDLLESVFYNETQGVWFDFNRRTGSQQWANFYPSVAMPLFTGCYDQIDQGRSQRLFSYMKENGVFSFPGGIPTSMLRGTGEQWDFPNGWSPLNHIVVEGLRKSQNAEMEEQAFQLAKKWVLANFKVFKETNHMWEKYVVTGEPVPGTGGEYEVQDGFGWTNGVVLDLLVAYRDRLFSPPPPVIVENGQRRNGAAFGLGQFYAIALLLYNSYCILFAINQ